MAQGDPLWLKIMAPGRRTGEDWQSYAERSFSGLLRGMLAVVALVAFVVLGIFLAIRIDLPAVVFGLMVAVALSVAIVVVASRRSGSP